MEWSQIRSPRARFRKDLMAIKCVFTHCRILTSASQPNTEIADSAVIRRKPEPNLRPSPPCPYRRSYLHRCLCVVLASPWLDTPQQPAKSNEWEK